MGTVFWVTWRSSFFGFQLLLLTMHNTHGNASQAWRLVTSLFTSCYRVYIVYYTRRISRTVLRNVAWCVSTRVLLVRLVYSITTYDKPSSLWRVSMSIKNYLSVSKYLYFQFWSQITTFWILLCSCQILNNYSFILTLNFFTKYIQINSSSRP